MRILKLSINLPLHMTVVLYIEEHLFEVFNLYARPQITQLIN